MCLILVVKKLDRQGLPLVHKVTLVRLQDLSFSHGIFCNYKAQRDKGLLWAHYFRGSDLFAKRLTYLMADHLDFAPLWARYRNHRQAEPIASYWDHEAERIKAHIHQLQESAIISRDPTDEPSGLER
jgi:hypothetical protein